ncbi:MAG: 30S ribosomal protein S6 [Candidatus Paceibacterota bacterium]|jgi:ribosomal protein S6
MGIINEDIEKNSRIYEVGYLLLSSISDAEMPVIYGNLKDLITSLGGEIISDEMPKMISLAYAMLKVYQNVRNKFSTAYFGWIKFEMDPEKVLELKKKLDVDPNLIRFLILKTIRENTIAAKRFVHKDTRRKMQSSKKEGENEISLPIDKEEIDKEIDAMVAV